MGYSMKNIKFRAWHFALKEMGNLTNLDYTTFSSIAHVSIAYSPEIASCDVALMQYTGLKDREGIEVYEKDIVETAIGIGIVVYVSGSFGIMIDGLFTPFYNLDFIYKVLGNKYMNPELINENNKGMSEYKFRVIIPEKNVTIIFTLLDLFDNKFRNRKMLWLWLKAGNCPDLFTGLKDTEGVEIYENDILIQGKLVGYVKWLGSAFWWVDKEGFGGNLIGTEKYVGHMDFALQHGFGTKIIGNIHENPELMKKK